MYSETQKHILVVDDDPNIRDVVCFALDKAGMTTTAAKDGADLGSGAARDRAGLRAHTATARVATAAGVCAWEHYAFFGAVAGAGYDTGLAESSEVSAGSDFCA